MKKQKENRAENIAKYIVFLLAGVLIGVGTTFLFVKFDGTNIKVSNNKYNKKFKSLYETYETLKNEYYIDLDDSKLIEGAIDGMIKATKDEHTMFFNKQEKESFETSLAGSYYGIGAQITSVEEEITIVRIFDNSPAKNAGLKEGDIIAKVDGEDVKGWDVNDVASKLKSDKNPKATIIIKRDGEEQTIEIQKAIVEIPSISSEMMEDNIGYIYIGIFGINTDTEFDEALDSLKEQGMEKLIIDLRDNSGGYLSTVTNIMSKFVGKDKVLYQIKDKKDITSYKSLTEETMDYKVVVLVNGESASASEIMASMLQEQYGATLVGTKTYGKGSVQGTKELSNGTLIKYTIEEWLTSNGKSIEKEGITPDVEIELDESYFENYSDESDNQLQKALELLK